MRQESDWFWYLKEVVAEEFLFRYLPLTLCTDIEFAVMVSLIYGLAHLWKFNWLMVAITFPFGMILSKIFLILPQPLNFVVVIIIHFLLGYLGWQLNITRRLSK